MTQRIIWHTPEPVSAAARYPREMITALTAQGVPVHLVCPRNYQFREELRRNPLVTLHLTRARSVNTKRGLATKLWTNTRFLLSSAWTLVRTGRRGAIVHFQHVLHFPFSALFFACARLRACTVVFTVHDPVPHKWFLPPWLRWVERSSLSWVYHVSKTLIVHSEPGKRALIEHFAIASDKITVIGRGPYELGGGVIPMPESNRLEILLFGSIRENKGVHLAIEAVQKLYRQGAAVRLTIAGEVVNGKEDSYWECCREQIARDPEPIRLRKEFIPDKMLPQVFADCHCILLPYTTFFSDSGVAYMALSNGRPIIATRAGGLGPLLDAAELGVTIRETTPEGVADALREALRLGVPELARRGHTGADYVNIECGWPKVARNTRSVYARYAPSRAKPAPRVIFHTPEPKSAAARYVWELIGALAEDGLDATLVCPRNFQFRAELQANPRVALYLARERSTCNKRSLFIRIRDNLAFLASSLTGLLRCSRPGDLVHFQFMFHFPLGALFFLVARVRGLKIVFTVHDPKPHRWLLPSSLRWLEQSALTFAYRASDRLIVHNEPGKRTLIDCFHQDPSKISVIAHGPYSLGSGVLPMIESDTLELLLFGSIRENKGHHLAIQAVQSLHDAGESVRLTIAGDVSNSKEQAYWTQCLGLIERNPAPIRVIQQFVPDSQLPDLFSRSHCVLLPYTDFFSDSGVAQMALANGRPIIATRSGGLGPLMEAANVGIPIEAISVAGAIEAIKIALRLGLHEMECRGITGAIAVNQQSGGWKKIAVQTRGVYRRLSCDAPGSLSETLLESKGA